MMNLRELDECLAWPTHLMPEGYGDHFVEPFDTWWRKHGAELSHLPPEALEQWVHRHWSDSIASFVPLGDLICSEETWPAVDFIERVGTVRGNEPLEPEHDFKIFSGQLSGEKLSTATALDRGNWDYAPIVLHTPDGFVDWIGEHIATPFFLVEGHKRRRYLNALLHKGNKICDQRVFVLRSPAFD